MHLMIARQIGSDRAAADAALQAFIKTYAGLSAFQIAETYALRSEPDKAFEWLDRAWTNRDPGISFLLFDSYLLRYRDVSCFVVFCCLVNLPLSGADASVPAGTPASASAAPQ